MTTNNQRESFYLWVGCSLHSMPWENSLMLPEHNVPSIWGEVRCYSPLLFLLFCLIKAIILLSHLLLCLSYRDSEISLKLLTLISLHLPPQCRTTLSSASNSFGDGGLLLLKAVFVIRNWNKTSSVSPMRQPRTASAPDSLDWTQRTGMEVNSSVPHHQVPNKSIYSLCKRLWV